MSNKEKLTGKARTLKEISNAYGVGAKVMKNWLKCPSLSYILGDRIGNYFTVKQIHAIVEHLGEPD